MQDLPLDTGAILALVLEAALWGFSVFMFGWTMFMLCRKCAPSKTSKKSVAIACVLLILSTAHVTCNTKRVVTAYGSEHGNSAGDPAAFLTRLNRYSIVSYATYCLQTLVGDAVLICRCHTVWQSFTVILVPMVLWCGMVVTLVGSLHGVVRGSNDADALFSVRVTDIWITSFYSLTLVTNLVTTALLAYRIWKVDRDVSLNHTRVMRNGMLPIMMVFIDAGALYSAMLIAAIITLAVQSPAIIIVIDLIVPMISCIFYFILIRIGLSQTKNQSFLFNMSCGRAQARTLEFIRNDESQVPIEVRITRSVTASVKDLHEPHSPARERWREGL